MSGLKLGCSNGQREIGRVAEELGKWSGEHICAKSATCSLHKISDKIVLQIFFGRDDSNEEISRQ